ncbi:5'(3')-deoxyribonucleotidase [Granulicella rosea]|uniref:5'(3')-deoxyribonucleotidase n=2 Tax=Granulicella rosea TaxID=474952 RepID=A0A239LN52_9BACT|nr:5'(3')-deoxyribonucleotidase [Granulicella rosea]
MDEVIADAVTEHLLRYNRDFNEELTQADLHGKWLWDVVRVDRHPALEAYMCSQDFFRVLNVMPHSQRVIRDLQKDYEVFIATAAMEVPTSFMAKYHWLAEHFPFIPPSNVVYCGDKAILKADYLIDDNPRQLRRFTGEGILYSAPHNVNVTGFRRVKDWLAVEQMFLSGNGRGLGDL